MNIFMILKNLFHEIAKQPARVTAKEHIMSCHLVLPVTSGKVLGPQASPDAAPSLKLAS